MSILSQTASQVSLVTWGAIVGLLALLFIVSALRALVSRLPRRWKIFSLGSQSEEFYVPGDRFVPGAGYDSHDDVQA